ncbi:MAG: hypothetical protein JXQ76_10915 [Campylobacterales bacterium]|nr:hypothetical protein [Campylobacterales bacterium]
MKLYALIKKGTKYAYQNSHHKEPFEVEIQDNKEYQIAGGIGGQYRICDLEFYIKIGREFVKLNQRYKAP